MSDEATAVEKQESAEGPGTESYPGSEFGRRELSEFSADDAEAGANIGKMLVIFFAYSLLAMMVVTLWTYFVAFKD